VVPDLIPHLRFLWRVLPALADGFAVTMGIAIAALALAIGCALALLWPRLSARRAIALPVRGYVEIVRNTPLLVQIYLLYFGLPLLGVPLSAAATGVLAIGLQHGGYLLEIFR